MGGHPMVMVPAHISNGAASRNKMPRDSRQSTLDGLIRKQPPLDDPAASNKPTRSKVPAIRKTQSVTSSVTLAPPRRGRPPKKAASLQEPPVSSTSASTLKSTNTLIKRKLDVHDDTDEGPLGEEEEDDGFAFRRKVPRNSKQAEAPPPKQPKVKEQPAAPATKSSKPEAKSRTLREADFEDDAQGSEQIPNGRIIGKASTTTRSLQPAAAKKQVQDKAAIPSNEFLFSGIADYPEIEPTDVQRPPIPKHKSNNPFVNNPVPDTRSRPTSQNGEFINNKPTEPSFPARAETPPPITSRKSQQVSLPVSDTPVIRKNQEMRKKNSVVRRSSLGNRGKRASSIGNGFMAVPHSAVNPKDYYKHLDTDLPEPHKMKQLLLWSLKRVMEKQEKQFEKIKLNPAVSAEDRTAFKIARYIQEEIVRDVTDGRINTGWWNRPEDSDFNETVKKPNVQNVTNQKNYEAFEKRHNELLKEREQWLKKLEEVRKTASLLSAPPTAPRPASQVEQDQKAIMEEYPLLETLQKDKSNSDAVTKLRNCLDEIEQEVDKLDDFTHKAQSIAKAANKFSYSRMVMLKDQFAKTRQAKLSRDESVLVSLVEDSQMRKSAEAADVDATSGDKSTTPVSLTNPAADSASMRDILRTITRLERMSPS